MQKSPAKLQVRIDRDLKNAAEAVFSEVGLDTTTAVRLFFTRVAQTQCIPFPLQAERPFSAEAEERILAAWKESQDTVNCSRPYSDVGQMMQDIRGTLTVEA